MKIKKLALIASIITSASLAHASDFYIKPMLGRMHSEKVLGLQAKPVVLPGIGVGYNLKDNMRIDLTLYHLSNLKHTTTLKSGCGNNGSEEPNSGLIASNQICLHTKITTIKINFFVDVAEVNDSKLYLGFGIGESRIISYSSFGEEETKPTTKYSLAYAFYSGLAHRVQDNVIVEAGYSYKHFNEDTYNHKGHVLTTCLRIEL